MTGYFTNIEKEILENENFRKVLFTGKHAQLVVMTLKPNEDIGMETHPDVDQFFRIESGTGKVVMNGEETLFNVNDVFIVPAGVEHNVINTSSDNPLKLYTVYSPPNHPDGTVHATKEDAMKEE